MTDGEISIVFFPKKYIMKSSNEKIVEVRKMISFVSREIVRCLGKNNVIKIEKEEIYQYGFEILISSFITLVITIISGVLLNCLLASAIFFLIFASLRQICGGYHAEHYWSCNLIFTGVVNFVLLIYRFMPMEQYKTAHYVFALSSLCIIFFYAPVENKNKPLTIGKKKLFGLISKISVCILTVISCLIYILYDSPFTKLIDVTLIAVTLSIAVVVIKEEGSEKGEECKKGFS